MFANAIFAFMALLLWFGFILFMVRNGGSTSDGLGFVDVVVVPGGGVRAHGDLPPWVEQRLKAAIMIPRSSRRFIALLSFGTVHKAPPNDELGFPIRFVCLFVFVLSCHA